MTACLRPSLASLPAVLLAASTLLAGPGGGQAATAQAAASAADNADDRFLPVDQAFRGSARLADGHTLVLRFDVAPGYHLYRERFQLRPVDGASDWTAPLVPPGRLVHDANLDEDLHLWESQTQVSLALAPGATRAAAGQPRMRRLDVNYQGCADAGLCYPPQRAVLTVRQDADGRLADPRWQADDGNAASATDTTSPPGPQTAAPAADPAGSAPAAAADSGATGALRSGNLLLVAGVFLLAGLLLSLTPCVLPMVPILSAIIVGQGGPGGAGVSRGRGFALALAYALGMAAVYTLFGVAAGLAGEGLSAALQNAWVLGGFALLLVALAGSMFGLYELQLPSALQSRLSATSQRLPGGRFGGVFLMGGLSALIVGPCVAAPLAGALVYISQTRDVLLGGLALFCLALGMSVPLLAVGASASALLPRTGAWMASVKTVFGVLLLAVALWLVSPVLPPPALLALTGGLLISVATMLLDAATRRRRLRPFGLALALLAGLAGASQVVGALSGGDSLWQPLRHLARGATAVPGTSAAARAGSATEGPVFQHVTSLAALDRALQHADRPVMLDVAADWCVACRELEHTTFTDPQVRQRLDHALLLRADVTANDADQRALLRRFGLFGPPGVLFFDARGRELTAARIVGYQPPPQFLQQLDRAGL